MATLYRVNWDNGAGACGEFWQAFQTWEAADQHGREWAAECNLRDFGTAEPEGDCYTYDVVEVADDAEDEPEDVFDPMRDGWVGKDGRP